MKLRTARSMMVIIFSLSFLNVVKATSIMKSNCPDKFVGKVIKIRDSLAPSLSYSLTKQDVVLEDIKSKILKTMTVLKFGPTKFRNGEKFYVEMNQGLICTLNKI